MDWNIGSTRKGTSFDVLFFMLLPYEPTPEAGAEAACRLCPASRRKSLRRRIKGEVGRGGRNCVRVLTHCSSPTKGEVGRGGRTLLHKKGEHRMMFPFLVELGGVEPPSKQSA